MWSPTRHEVESFRIIFGFLREYFSTPMQQLQWAPVWLAGWLAHLLPVMYSGSFSDHGVGILIGAVVIFFGVSSEAKCEDLC
jgi:hypothetical protein